MYTRLEEAHTCNGNVLSFGTAMRSPPSSLTTLTHRPDTHTRAHACTTTRTLNGGALSLGAAMLAAMRSSFSSLTRTPTGNAELRGAAGAAIGSAEEKRMGGGGAAAAADGAGTTGGDAVP